MKYSAEGESLQRDAAGIPARLAACEVDATRVRIVSPAFEGRSAVITAGSAAIRPLSAMAEAGRADVPVESRGVDVDPVEIEAASAKIPVRRVPQVAIPTGERSRPPGSRERSPGRASIVCLVNVSRGTVAWRPTLANMRVFSCFIARAALLNVTLDDGVERTARWFTGASRGEHASAVAIGRAAVVWLCHISAPQLGNSLAPHRKRLNIRVPYPGSHAAPVVAADFPNTGVGT